MGAPEFTLVIATFAIGLIIRALIRIHWQDNVFFLPAPYTGLPLSPSGHCGSIQSYLVIIATTVVLVTLLIVFFQQTRLGKAMRAVSFNPIAARLMGIGVGRIFGSAWALSAAIGALAGLLLAPVVGINPELGHLIIKALVAAVIGGFGSLGGAVFRRTTARGTGNLCRRPVRRCVEGNHSLRHSDRFSARAPARVVGRDAGSRLIHRCACRTPSSMIAAALAVALPVFGS